MGKFSQTLLLIIVAEIVITTAQTKLFLKVESVLCGHIIYFGKYQSTFIIK